MKYNNVEIDDTYAEAFGIQVARVLITAATEFYAKNRGYRGNGLRHVGHRLSGRSGHRLFCPG